MVEFFDPIAQTNISYHIDAKLLKIWDKLKERGLVNINEDRVYLVDGREGSGKSTWAFQQAKYLNPEFTLEHICFHPEDFLHQIRNAPKGSVVVFDEAFRGLSSKASRSNVNKEIVQALMESRQRSLVIFIVLPTFFLLEMYAAVFRSEALFHIYKMKGKKDSPARAFKIYNYAKKKTLYLRGKTKYFSYKFPIIKRSKGKFLFKRRKDGLWVPYNTFDKQGYDHKKYEAFKKKKEEEKLSAGQYKYEQVIVSLINSGYYTQKQLADMLSANGHPITQPTISKIVAKHG